MSSFALPAPVRPPPPWGTFASLALHGGLGALLLLSALPRPLQAPPPRPIAVELVTQLEFDALSAPAEVPPALVSPQGPEPAAVAKPKTNGTVTATQFYAAGILKQPAMKRIHDTLAGFANNDRVMQLCNIEGLEQIRQAMADSDPDTLVSYAMADVTTSGLTLVATGGAFRSKRRWYSIQFRCTAAPDLEGVSAFTFRLGAAIPEAEAENHDLYAEDPELD